MIWNPLTDSGQLNELLKSSFEGPLVIFKHSTRCSISAMAKNRLERQWEESFPVPAFYLDLIAYRSISNEIASSLAIEHESPQLLLISQGKCVYNSSHSEISFEDLKQAIKDL